MEYKSRGKPNFHTSSLHLDPGDFLPAVVESAKLILRMSRPFCQHDRNFRQLAEHSVLAITALICLGLLLKSEYYAKGYSPEILSRTDKLTSGS